MNELMKIEGLKMYFGGLKAIDGLDLSVNEGETLAIIGPNGAGKSTLIKSIMGIVQPKSGSILYNGQDITKLPAHRRASLGIGYVPEGRRVFGRLTVEENLRMGAYELKDKQRIKDNIEKVYEIFPG